MSYLDPGIQGAFALMRHFWEQAFRDRVKNPELWVARRLAEYYAQRAEMDGEVIKSTGEVVAKDTV